MNERFTFEKDYAIVISDYNQAEDKKKRNAVLLKFALSIISAFVDNGMPVNNVIQFLKFKK